MDLHGAFRFPPATLIVGMMLFAGASTVHAAGASRIPRSALPDVRTLDTVERREMPRVDVQRLLAEDAERQRTNVPLPTRYAINHQVSLTPETSGTWETLDDGSRLWRLRLSSPGALSISLGIEEFGLRAGTAFWIHAPDGSRVQGPSRLAAMPSSRSSSRAPLKQVSHTAGAQQRGRPSSRSSSRAPLKRVSDPGSPP